MASTNGADDDRLFSLRELSPGSPDRVLIIGSDDSFPAGTIVRETSRQRAHALEIGAPQTVSLKGIPGDAPGDYTVILVPCPQEEVVALVHDVSKLLALEEQLLRM